MFIATLIAAGRLDETTVRTAGRRLTAAGCGPDAFEWLDRGDAASIAFRSQMERAREALEDLATGVDVVVQPALHRRKRLLVADMDSTMITVECIDELAGYAGVREEVAAITERAMRGELAFEEALAARVALLRGLEESVLDQCHAERVRAMPGAKALVATMRANGAYCVLVSGGFSRFADRVAAEIGFDRAVSNALPIAAGRVAGTVERPIVGAAGKRQALLDAAAAQGIALEQTLAVGDGANDIPMIEAAGLGVAYHAKPATAAAADARIEHNDLSGLLWAQGYARSEWAAV
jgi:phosphoserine phosphatase